jgi:hypothetical protein
MIHIKDADGAAQFEALGSILDRSDINFVDIGGGRGETNALMKAIRERGGRVHVLNIEPHKPFTQLYLDAQKAAGVNDVQVWEQSAQQVSAEAISHYFGNKKVDVVYASHSFYFLLGDMFKASLKNSNNTSAQLRHHPLWKFFDILKNNGVFIITLQSGAGARLFRNALLGNDGLGQPALNCADETVPLLSSFGNMASFLRYFQPFADRYKAETGKVIVVKMYLSVANVPLGNFTMVKDQETGGYKLQNSEKQETLLAQRMLDFYGNWGELQDLATLSDEKYTQMSPEAQKKLGLLNLSKEEIIAKRDNARKMQETFLHILRMFAPAQQCMQHPNITLKMSFQ